MNKIPESFNDLIRKTIERNAVGMINVHVAYGITICVRKILYKTVIFLERIYPNRCDLFYFYTDIDAIENMLDIDWAEVEKTFLYQLAHA